MTSSGSNSPISIPSPNNYQSSPTEITFPYQNLFSDCIHVIFHFHLFWFQISEHCSGMSDNPHKPIFVKDSKSTYVIENGDDPDWQFMTHFAHCAMLSPARAPYDSQSRSMNRFLHHCKHRIVRETFYYLHLSRTLRTLRGINAELLRGVSKLDMTNAIVSKEELIDILKNVRGVESLALEGTGLALKGSSFDYIRGVQELTLCDFDIRDATEAEHLFGNLRGLKRLEMVECALSSDFFSFVNPKDIHIQALELIDCTFPPENGESRGVTLSDKCMGQLRGIRELIVCDSFAFSNVDVPQLTDEGFKNLRGIQTLSLTDSFFHDNVTDAAMENLRGIQSLSLNNFPRITGAMFEQLRGVKELTMDRCPRVAFSSTTLKNLRGIRILSWKDELVNPSTKWLQDDCLKQLCGVKELYLDNVVTQSDDAFRYLHEVTKLELSGPTADFDTNEQNIPLGDAAFSYLRNVEWMELRDLKLDVSNFSKLFRDNMPKLRTFRITNCLVPTSSIEEIKQFGAYMVAEFESDETDGEEEERTVGKTFVSISPV